MENTIKKDLIGLEGSTAEMAMGEVFAKSGMFPDIKNAAQGYIKILAGKELGLSPIQALGAFYFVNGKIGIVSQAMAVLVKRSPNYDYEIIEHTEIICSIQFYKTYVDKREKIGFSSFDIKAAARAGIVNKDVWKNYPKNMLFARALMNGVRWYCPDAVSAIAYSVEELQDMVPEKVETTVILNNDKGGKNGTKKI